MMHLHKEFSSKSFETRCWNEAAKYWNNLSKGTTAENLDQGEAKRRMNSWQTCSSFLLCFSQIFLKLRTVTNCPSKMRLIRIVGPLYSIIWCKGFIKFYYNTYLGCIISRNLGLLGFKCSLIRRVKRGVTERHFVAAGSLSTKPSSTL